jgi:hypothetical protein
VKRSLVLTLAAVVVAGCAAPPGQSPPQPPTPPPATTLGPGLVREDVGGRPRLFSKLGFLMLDEPLRTQLLTSYTETGQLDHAKLRQNLKEARIVEGSNFVAVALPAGYFKVFLLRDGPWISLDPQYDAMVQRMAARVAPSN